MRIPMIAVPAVLALALGACAASEDDAGMAVSQAPVASAAGGDATAAPGADADWAVPNAPDIFKFRKDDFLTGEEFDGTSMLYHDVVLWFWASWCPVCNAEAGALVKASESFPDDVTVIAVAGLSDVPASKQFVADHPGIEQFINIYDDDGAIWKDFEAVSQPTLVLINQDGQSKTYQGGYGTNDIIEKVAWLGEN